MPDLATYVAFLAAVLLMQVTPGPDMALEIGRGSGRASASLYARCWASWWPG
jgi:threonine/homoserine/homoserine lactone efflux protein